MSTVAEAGAAYKQNEALRLDQAAQRHKHEARRQRLQMVSKLQKRDELIAECARLGIKVVLHPTSTMQPEGGHDDSSQENPQA